MNAKGYFVDAGQNSRKTGINPLREHREAYRVVLARGQGDGLLRLPAAPVSYIGLSGFVARAAIFNRFLIGVTRKAEDAQTNLDSFEGFFLHLAGEYKPKCQVSLLKEDNFLKLATCPHYIKWYRLSHRPYLVHLPAHKRMYPEPLHKSPNKVPNKLLSYPTTGYCLAGELSRAE